MTIENQLSFASDLVNIVEHRAGGTLTPAEIEDIFRGHLRLVSGTIKALIYQAHYQTNQSQKSYLQQITLETSENGCEISLTARSINLNLDTADQNLLEIDNLSSYEPLIQDAAHHKDKIGFILQNNQIKRLIIFPDFLRKLSRDQAIKRTKKSDSTKQDRLSMQVHFLGGISATQQTVFEAAAARWQEVICEDLPTIRVNGEDICGLVVKVEGRHIDGPQQTLAQSGPTYLRPDSLLPATGVMEFDIADLTRMEADGSLFNCVVHEIGHVLGFGTIWKQLGLIQDAGTHNPTFTGQNAMREFANLLGSGAPTPVPVENTGGPGTMDGHWRESMLGNEVMTGFLGEEINPFSRITLAAFQDMGYQVNLDVADSFALTHQLELATRGKAMSSHQGSHQRCSWCCSNIQRAKSFSLPKVALSKV
jgi:hypothetical protein